MMTDESDNYNNLTRSIDTHAMATTGQDVPSLSMTLHFPWKPGFAHDHLGTI